MAEIKAVFFDMDGTLIDASEPVCKLVAETIKEMCGKEVVPEKVMPYLGQPIWVFFEELAPELDGRIDEAVELYREKYAKAAPELTKLLPHARETLSMLKSKGVITGVVSQRPVLQSKEILGYMGLGELVDVVSSGEETEPKPAPDSILSAINSADVLPEETVMVGDTAMDMAAAKNAGARAVGVLTGTDGRKELESAGADVVLDDLTSFSLNIV